MVFELPPSIQGPAPTLTTINEIEVIIRSATKKGETPISLAEIKRRMKAKAVRHSTVKAAVEHLKRMGCVWTTEEGASEWCAVAPEFWREPVVRLR